MTQKKERVELITDFYDNEAEKKKLDNLKPDLSRFSDNYIDYRVKKEIENLNKSFS